MSKNIKSITHIEQNADGTLTERIEEVAQPQVTVTIEADINGKPYKFSVVMDERNLEDTHFAEHIFSVAAKKLEEQRKK